MEEEIVITEEILPDIDNAEEIITEEILPYDEEFIQSAIPSEIQTEYIETTEGTLSNGLTYSENIVQTAEATRGIFVFVFVFFLILVCSLFFKFFSWFF